MLELNMFKNAGSMLIRAALAAVWAYQGIWCKLLGREARQRAIAQAAGMGWVLAALGMVEAAIAIWVLSGWWPVSAAVLQTSLIAGMNVGGLWRGRRLIQDPAGMVLQNAAFLVLAWVAAGVLRAS
jgi:hypothetical protein